MHYFFTTMYWMLFIQLSFVHAFSKSSSSSTHSTSSSKSSTTSFHSTTSSSTSSKTTTTTSLLSCPTGTYEFDTSEDLTFDDIVVAPAGVGVGTAVPTGYGGVFIQAFSVLNTSGAVDIVTPHSSPNYIGTGSVVETVDGQPMMSVNFPGSQATSFDVESMWLSCSLSTDNNLLAPPQACIISMTGYTGSDNSISNSNFACAYTVSYDPSTALSDQMMTYSGTFPSTCKNITFLIWEFNILPASLNSAQERLALNVDNIQLTVHGCNSTEP